MASILEILNSLKENSVCLDQSNNLYNKRYITYEANQYTAQIATNKLNANLTLLKQYDPKEVHEAIVTTNSINIVGTGFIEELKLSVQLSSTELETLLNKHGLILAKGKYINIHCVEEQMYITKLSNIIINKLPNIINNFEGNFGIYRSAINSLLLSLPIIRNLQDSNTVLQELQANLKSLDTSDVSTVLIAKVEIGREANLVTFKSKDIMDTFYPTVVNSTDSLTSILSTADKYKGFTIIISPDGFTSPEAGITKVYTTLSGIQSAIRAKHK